MGGPSGELRNTSHDICRGSFSLSVFISPSMTPLTLPPGQSDTQKVRGGTTMRRKEERTTRKGIPNTTTTCRTTAAACEGGGNDTVRQENGPGCMSWSVFFLFSSSTQLTSKSHPSEARTTSPTHHVDEECPTAVQTIDHRVTTRSAQHRTRIGTDDRGQNPTTDGKARRRIAEPNDGGQRRQG